MVRVNPSLLLKALPLVAGFGFTVTFIFPGFRTATAAFAVTKILEYSVRCDKTKTRRELKIAASYFVVSFTLRRQHQPEGQHQLADFGTITPPPVSTAAITKAQLATDCWVWLRFMSMLWGWRVGCRPIASVVFGAGRGYGPATPSSLLCSLDSLKTWIGVYLRPVHPLYLASAPRSACIVARSRQGNGAGVGVSAHGRSRTPLR